MAMGAAMITRRDKRSDGMVKSFVFRSSHRRESRVDCASMNEIVFIARRPPGHLGRSRRSPSRRPRLVAAPARACRSGRVAPRARPMEAAVAAERAREMDDKVAELTRIQSEMTGRMQTIGRGLRHAAERLRAADRRAARRPAAPGRRRGSRPRRRTRHENLAKLNERLAVIDAAQKNLTDLTGEVVGAQGHARPTSRRAAPTARAGWRRSSATGCPRGAYEFQATLSNRTRPDCLIRLPGDERGARRRRQVPARRLHRVPRRAATTRRARRRGQRVRARHRRARQATSPSSISCPARRRTWR